MAWPDKFALCASNIFVNHVVDFTGVWGGNGFYNVVDWNVIYPPEDTMVIPQECETQKEYLPGQETLEFWDYSEMNVGYASFSITWAAMRGPDVTAIFQEYDYAVNNTQNRVWLTVPRMETGGWMYTSGVMEEPTVQEWKGDTALGLTINFGRLGFHLNAITNDRQVSHYEDYIVDKDYFGYFCFNNDNFRPSDWNY